jgi:glutathionyl-hydroquinone reductase
LETIHGIGTARQDRQLQTIFLLLLKRLCRPQHPDEVMIRHLYVGNPCPWCHKAVLAVKLLGMDEDK